MATMSNISLLPRPRCTKILGEIPGVRTLLITLCFKDYAFTIISALREESIDPSHLRPTSGRCSCRRQLILPINKFSRSYEPCARRPQGNFFSLARLILFTGFDIIPACSNLYLESLWMWLGRLTASRTMSYHVISSTDNVSPLNHINSYESPYAFTVSSGM